MLMLLKEERKVLAGMVVSMALLVHVTHLSAMILCATSAAPLLLGIQKCTRALLFAWNGTICQILLASNFLTPWTSGNKSTCSGRTPKQTKPGACFKVDQRRTRSQDSFDKMLAPENMDDPEEQKEETSTSF